MKPTPAPPSIIPSMPMLMMPTRSDQRPVIAPRAIGVASTSDSSNRLITLVLTELVDSARAIPMISGTASAAATTWAISEMRSCFSGRNESPPAIQ